MPVSKVQRFHLSKILIALIAVISHVFGNDTFKANEDITKNRVINHNNNEYWHGDSTSPSIDYEPTIVSTSDFYLKEILKQLVAINRKIDRALIRLVGSTVRGDDNSGNNRKALYSNFTEPNCESLMKTDSQSGIYRFPNKTPENKQWIWNIFEVYCDQTFGGGWTVVQRRGDRYGLNFTSKCWDDYAKGFGDLGGDFWFGNEWMHRLTTLFGPYELRIEFEDLLGHRSSAQYEEFTVGSHKDNYRLRISGYRGENFTDSLITNDSKVLTNYSWMSDLVKLDHACSMDFHGTWWSPDNCLGVNLNSDNYKKTKMMIRSKINRVIDVASNDGVK